MKKTKNLLLLVLCGIVFLSFAVGSGSTVESSNESGGTESEKKELKTYKINEDIVVTKDEGKYRIRITNVEETTRRNQFSDIQAQKVVLISYEYENMTMENDLSVSELGFKLYDKDNNKLETYPDINQKYGGSVSKGRKTSSVDAYALNNDNNYIELEYYDNMFNSKPDFKVILEW